MRNPGSKLSSLAMLMALASSMSSAMNEHDSPTSFNPDSAEDKPEPIHKGHSSFVIDGIEIYALNKKNAIKKHKKLISNL